MSTARSDDGSCRLVVQSRDVISSLFSMLCIIFYEKHFFLQETIDDGCSTPSSSTPPVRAFQVAAEANPVAHRHIGWLEPERKGDGKWWAGVDGPCIYSRKRGTPESGGRMVIRP